MSALEFINPGFGRINHVAYMTQDKDRTQKMLRRVGLEMVDWDPAQVPEGTPIDGPWRDFMSSQKVWAGFTHLKNVKFEPLFAPRGSKHDNFFKDNPNPRIHHICFESENVLRSMQAVRGNGYPVIGDDEERGIKAKPTPGAHALDVFFLQPRSKKSPNAPAILIEGEQQASGAFVPHTPSGLVQTMEVLTIETNNLEQAVASLRDGAGLIEYEFGRTSSVAHFKNEAGIVVRVEEIGMSAEKLVMNISGIVCGVSSPQTTLKICTDKGYLGGQYEEEVDAMILPDRKIMCVRPLEIRRDLGFDIAFTALAV